MAWHDFVLLKTDATQRASSAASWRRRNYHGGFCVANICALAKLPMVPGARDRLARWLGGGPKGHVGASQAGSGGESRRTRA